MRNLLITFFFLIIGLITLTVFVGNDKAEARPVLRKVVPHMFGDDTSSIQNINLTIFYFVPKDAITKRNEAWQKDVEAHIKNLTLFHSSQFRNTSKITYTFFPEIILGLKTTKEYEGLFDGGENDALIPIKQEITSRIRTQNGELFYASSQKNKDSNTRNAYLVIFEGKGGAGNDDFALVSHAYLTENQYKENGSTFLAHEFYHTLGLPDNYQSSFYVFKDGKESAISLVTSKDIMGQVNIPLSRTYIDVSSLKKMGL